MQICSSRRGFAVAAALVIGVGSVSPAAAQPDQSVTSVISEDDGFPGVCASPCFEVEKTAEVFLSGNASGPGVCAAGLNTYVYTLTHLGGTLPSPGIPVTEFELAVDFNIVASAGSIAGGGIAPTSTNVSPLNVVSWAFPLSTACPGCLNQGNTSDKLFVCSTAPSGTTPVSITAIVLDASGSCTGPISAVVTGEPNPCTIGFWKARATGKNGTLQHFSGSEFATTVAGALTLSGVFTSADLSLSACPNFNDLLCALTSKGNRTTEERARQQLAATLLNLSAGINFPDNGKCVVFDANNITANACGIGTTVGTGVDDSIAGILSGDSALEQKALECLDDINNGEGVIF